MIDARRWRERQVTHGFAKKNGSTMVTKAQSANGSIAKAPSDRSPAIDFDRFDRFELPAAQHLGSLVVTVLEISKISIGTANG